MQIGYPIKQNDNQNIAFPSSDYLKTFFIYKKKSYLIV